MSTPWQKFGLVGLVFHCFRLQVIQESSPTTSPSHRLRLLQILQWRKILVLFNCYSIEQIRFNRFNWVSWIRHKKKSSITIHSHSTTLTIWVWEAWVCTNSPGPWHRESQRSSLQTGFRGCATAAKATQMRRHTHDPSLENLCPDPTRPMPGGYGYGGYGISDSLRVLES